MHAAKALTLILLALPLIPATVLAQPGPGGHRGPPPEAIEACVDLDADDACSFEHHDDELVGTCEPGPRDDQPLACKPAPKSRH